MEKIKICSKCIYDSNITNISFDENGDEVTKHREVVKRQKVQIGQKKETRSVIDVKAFNNIYGYCYSKLENYLVTFFDKNLIQLFGNIELKKGKMNITCKTLNAYGKKQKIKAFGGVNFNYEDIKGSCEIAEYDTKSQLLVLNGDAEAWQFGNRLNGDRIFIDLKGQKIRTQGKAKVKLIMKEERKEDQK